MNYSRPIINGLRGLTGLTKFATKSGLLGGEAGQIADMITPWISLVADLAEGGFDPKIVCKRVRVELLQRELSGVDGRWEKKQDELFGKGEDIYEG